MGVGGLKSLGLTSSLSDKNIHKNSYRDRLINK